MKLRSLVTPFSILIILSGCGSIPQQASSPASEAAGNTSLEARALETQPLETQVPQIFLVDFAGLAELAAEPTPEPEKQLPPADLWERMRLGLSWHIRDEEAHTKTQNAAVDRARRGILRQSQYLNVVANRANYYLHYIVEEVEKRQLPIELALLPLVESTLNPFASSPSHAAGLWQIMPRTGRHLSLQQNWWYDGRRDVRDSTRAALDYLEQLNEKYDQDWMLTLAAYNAGTGRVNRARRANARRGAATDYWSLKLPRETRDYLPKMIALAQIIADPKRYGVEIPAVKNAPAFDVVATGGQLELYRAARLANIDLGTLRAFNPGHLRWATSPDRASELLLPLGARDKFERGLATLDESDRVQWEHYRIVRGDSLIRIAKKFNTQVKLLREVNGVRGSRIRAGDTLLIPQGDDWAQSLALASNTKSRQQGYRVRRGDSLSRIAGKFKVSINDLIAWNALDPGEYLQPGQKLTLLPTGG